MISNLTTQELTAAIGKVEEALKRSNRHFDEPLAITPREMDWLAVNTMEALALLHTICKEIERLTQPVDIDEGAKGIWNKQPRQFRQSLSNSLVRKWGDLPPEIKKRLRDDAQACARAWKLPIKEEDE